MQEEGALRIVSTKGTCLKPTCKSINALLTPHSAALPTLTSISIMHSPTLVSLDGLHQLTHLTILKLASNQLVEVELVGRLAFLEKLDVKTNKIRSLKGIQSCKHLIEVDASHNRIEDWQGWKGFSADSPVQNVALFDNRLELEGIQCWSKFKQLKRIAFKKGKNTNPMCNREEEYHIAIGKYLKHVDKIDDFTEEELKQLKNNEDHSQQNHSHNNSKTNAINQNAYKQQGNRSSNNLYRTPMTPMTSPLLLATTQQLKQLTQAISYKEQRIEQLQHKQSKLQLSNAQQYKQLIKKEAELDRVYGQMAQLNKSLQNKQSKLMQLHKRIQECMKNLSSSNNTIDRKSQQLDKLRQQISELRIENAQYRTVSREQQRRLAELQSKALTNIEDKVIKQEQLRHKLEDLTLTNRDLSNQNAQLKDRIREVTTLLRQWEYKYEHKVKDLQRQHNQHVSSITRAHQLYQQEAMHKQSQQRQQIYHDAKEQVKQMQAQYKQALQSTLQRHKQLKKLYEEKEAALTENKLILKTVLDKNRQQEDVLKEFQQLFPKLKKELMEAQNEKEAKSRELTLLKASSNDHLRQMQMELSQLMHHKSTLQHALKQSKQTISVQQSQLEHFKQKQADTSEYEQQIENLTAALQAKNVMLDDKNQTIQTMKQQIQTLIRDKGVSIEQHDKVVTNCNKYRDRSHQLRKKVDLLIVENQNLKQQVDMHSTLEEEFLSVKDILSSQETSLLQKDKTINQLIALVQECKRVNMHQKQETEQLRRQVGRMGIEFAEKERRWNRELAQVKTANDRKVRQIQQEMSNYRRIAMQVKQLQGLTKGLQF